MNHHGGLYTWVVLLYAVKQTSWWEIDSKIAKSPIYKCWLNFVLLPEHGVIDPGFPTLVLKETWLNYFQTIPALPTADYLDQVCSVNQKLEDTISDEFGVGEGKMNYLLAYN